MDRLKKNVTISVRISEEQRARLAQLATESDHTLSKFVSLVIRDFLADKDRKPKRATG